MEGPHPPAPSPKTAGGRGGAEASGSAAGRVAAVTVNWNGADDTLACLNSLAAQTGIASGGLDLVVVDNASADDPVARIRKHHPSAQVISLPENRYYAGALAVGAAAALDAGARWLLILNNDTVAAPHLVARLLAAAEGDPRCAIACPTIYLHDRPEEVWPSAGYRRPLTLAAVDTTRWTTAQDPPRPVDWCTGCCMLVRAAAWRELGGFDAAAFPFYYDDHDFCLRARAAGWTIYHAPAGKLWHKVARSAVLGSPRQGYLYGRGSVAFFRRHTQGAHRAFIVVYRLGSLLLTAARSVAMGRPGYAAAYGRGIWDGVREAAAPHK